MCMSRGILNRKWKYTRVGGGYLMRIENKQEWGILNGN